MPCARDASTRRRSSPSPQTGAVGCRSRVPDRIEVLDRVRAWLLGFGAELASSSRASWPTRSRVSSGEPPLVTQTWASARSVSCNEGASWDKRDSAQMSTSTLAPCLARACRSCAKKPPVDAVDAAHTETCVGPFWQKIPAYADVDEATFLDHAWQAKNSITKVAKLVETIQELVPAGFIEDLEKG
jgi:hypothetical protein